VIVSTDSEAYAQVAREHGAEVPFLRPAELAKDDTPDLPVFEHCLNWLRENKGYVPDLVVHLRPTCPVRESAVIDEIIQILIDRPDLDSVRTITPVTHPPFKMWYRGDDGMLSAVAPLPDVREPWNQPRQQLPPTFLQTASIDVIRTSVITQQHSMTGQRIYGYLEHDFFDIDTEAELAKASLAMSPASPPTIHEGKQRTFCFDIDGVIAGVVPSNDYTLAKPQAEMIQRINCLHDAGHRIVLMTARGSATKIDWKDLTIAQLKQWGIRYDELLFGKPAADFYFDDRMMSLSQLDEFLSGLEASREK
jgi:CMP-N,N'-diacetyllegionaminic acid synthase